MLEGGGITNYAAIIAFQLIGKNSTLVSIKESENISQSHMSDSYKKINLEYIYNKNPWVWPILRVHP